MDSELDPSDIDGYYEFNSLNCLNDFHFIQPESNSQHRHQQLQNFTQAGVGIEGLSAVPQTATLPTSHQPYHDYDSMDLNLLSAENYHNATYEETSSRRHGSGSEETQLYGGLLVRSPFRDATPSSPQKPTTRRSSKKDASKSTGAEDSNSRPRGRPRLDTRDQSAAERRRTQIRLAQRAYRQRKETTISALNGRVTSLETTIDDMHKTFLAFSETAIACGIQRAEPTVARNLKTTADRMAELASNAAHVDAEEEDLDQSLPTPTTEAKGRRPKERQSNTSPISNQPPVLGYHTTFEDDGEAADDDGETARLSSVMPPPQLQNFPVQGWTSTEAMQQYQIDGPAPENNSIWPSENVQQYQVPTLDVNNPSNFNVPQYNTQTSDDDATKDLLPSSALPQARKHMPGGLAPPGQNPSDIISLPVPQSYASHEASFARRLMRFSVEMAYRLMTNPDSNPEDVRRFCRLSWCFTNSYRIQSHLKDLIERGVNQNLELWDVPAWHVGGAGLHYPRVGIDASSTPPEWWAREGPTGPFRPPHPETPVSDSMPVKEVIEKIGFDGDWFDSNDVEQYLHSKGLHLDGQSSIVELKEDDSIPALDENRGPWTSSPAVSSSQSSTDAPHSPNNEDMNLTREPFLQGSDLMWRDETVGISTFPDLDMDFTSGDIGDSDPKSLLPDFDFNMFPNTMPTFNTKIKKFIDVEKFLDTMVQSVVCLGRTPGFRKATVDSALTLATVEHA